MTDKSFIHATSEVAYKHNAIERDRHRLSKELAQELRGQMGDGAYLFCVEKLSGNTERPELWRDVLTWLTETEIKGNEDERI
jgi:hypothetical protein